MHISWTQIYLHLKNRSQPVQLYLSVTKSQLQIQADLPNSFINYENP